MDKHIYDSLSSSFPPASASSSSFSFQTFLVASNRCIFAIGNRFSKINIVLESSRRKLSYGTNIVRFYRVARSSNSDSRRHSPLLRRRSPLAAGGRLFRLVGALFLSFEVLYRS